MFKSIEQLLSNLDFSPVPKTSFLVKKKKKKKKKKNNNQVFRHPKIPFINKINFHHYHSRLIHKNSHKNSFQYRMAGFYGLSTFLGYLMPNLVFIYIY